MKKLICFAVLLVMGLSVSIPSQGQQKKKLIPITTQSEKALALYNEAMKAAYKVDFAKFLDLANQALKEDPGFFRVNVDLAFYYFNLGITDQFKKYALNAIDCKAKLSKGELLVKDLVAKLVNNQAEDVTAIARKLVDMYPQDEYAYGCLSTAQGIIKDQQGAIGTMRKALEISENPGSWYNVLGYNYMAAKEYGEAGKAFDKYIELEPGNPNVYDSKGDYFYNIKDYQKAYESYLKAHAVDPNWSFDKAMYAKTVADSPLGDDETIKEMKAVRETILGEITASFKGDYEKWTDYFAHEPYTTWTQSAKDFYRTWNGWDEISTKYKDLLKQAGPSTVTLEGITGYIIRLYKDAAWVTFNAEIKIIEGKEEKILKSKEVRSLEKKDGQWKIIYLAAVYSSTWD